MALVCGKSLNKEEIKVIQKDMMSKMKLGKSMLSTLSVDSLLQKTSAKKQFKIPAKIIEISTDGSGFTCDVPENLIVVKEVKAAKKASGIFFLVTDFKLETKDESGEKQIRTAEEYGVIKCISLIPDGSKTVDLQKDIDKLKGAKDINDFISKASDIQNLYGASTPQPTTVVVEQRAKNTSTVNLDDVPVSVIEVLVMKEGTNFFGGTRSYKQISNVIVTHEGGEPDKEKVYKQIKVKYTVPGTSSVAKGQGGSFDINQILAKVTKDKNFTAGDIKSLNSGKIKGIMGSHQTDLDNALGKIDTSGPAGSLLAQFKGGIGNVDVSKSLSLGSQLANQSAKGTIVEGAVGDLTSGNIFGAFNKGLELNKQNGSIPSLPGNFDFSKTMDPTTALAGILSITSSGPSQSTLTQIDRAGSPVGSKINSPLVDSITLSKTSKEIKSVQVRASGTNFFSNTTSYQSNNKVVTLTDKYQEIKVTYTYAGPVIKPGEAFASRPLNTCTDIPKIKLNIPKLTKNEIASGVTLKSKIRSFAQAQPKTIPEAKPQSYTPSEVTAVNTSARPVFASGAGYNVVREYEKYAKKLANANNAYWNPKIDKVSKDYAAIKKEDGYKNLLAKQKRYNGISGDEMVRKGYLDDTEIAYFNRFSELMIQDSTFLLNKYLVQEIMDASNVIAIGEENEKLMIEVGESSMASFMVPKGAVKALAEFEKDRIWNKYSTDEDKEHLAKMIRYAQYQLAPEGIANENDRIIASLWHLSVYEKNVSKMKPIFDKMRAKIPPLYLNTKD